MNEFNDISILMIILIGANLVVISMFFDGLKKEILDMIQILQELRNQIDYLNDIIEKGDEDK